MELTRREAVAALAAIGITTGGAAVVTNDRWRDDSPEPGSVEYELKTMLALAEVLYPSDVTVTAEFVETYVLGRIDDNGSYRSGISEAIEVLDASAREQHGEPFVDLTTGQRDDLLYDLGMLSTTPDPEGTGSERVRYYLVNELLFALFTTPTGGELIGAENPTGYPGGLDAYQRGPQT